MNTQTHPIDARPARKLIAAFVLIVGLGVLALSAEPQSRSGTTQAPSTEAVAEFGD